MKPQTLSIVFIISLIVLFGAVLFNKPPILISSPVLKVELSNAIMVNTFLNDGNYIFVIIQKKDTAYYSEKDIKRIVHETAAKYNTNQRTEFTNDLFERIRFLVDKKEHIVVFQRYITVTVG